MNFAETVGLVYFGHVNQRDDDDQLIRGLTLSHNHRDAHYSVGSLYKYDVALVERTDTIRYPNKPAHQHRWLVMQFDLHTVRDIPHVFLGLHTHSDAFYATLFAKFSTLQRAPLGTFGMYDRSFTDRYAIYTTPAESLTVERLFDTEMTKIVAQHFGTLTVEISDGCLYLYSEHARISKHLLETMLQNGIWLAKHIDERAALL
jgi:hypothetical protein